MVSVAKVEFQPSLEEFFMIHELVLKGIFDSRSGFNPLLRNSL